NGEITRFDEPVSYREFMRDRAEWRIIEDDQTIADLAKLFFISTSGRTARDASVALPTSEATQPFERPPVDDDRREREAAEAKQRTIERHRQAGEFFDSVEDLKWLYFDLMLRGALDERELECFVLDGLFGERDLTGQAARYIEKPLFHCTALRDL